MSDTPRTTPTETFAAQIRSVLAQYNDPELPVTHLVGKLKAEVEKWRTAASVLCAAHVGKPQSSCPVCEVEKLKAYAQMADERLCKFTHGEPRVCRTPRLRRGLPVASSRMLEQKGKKNDDDAVYA